jgi:hypothetical protein
LEEKVSTPIIEKLQKLIAHEQSARTIGNSAEAAAFASKIQELLNVHKLNMADVLSSVSEVDDLRGIDVVKFSLNTTACRERYRDSVWLPILGGSIARANGCRALGYPFDEHSVVFAGREADRNICCVLFEYFVNLAEHLAEKYTEASKQKHLFKMCHNYGVPVKRGAELLRILGQSSNMNKWARDYKVAWKIGFAQAVGARFEKKAEEIQGAPEAIVLVKRDALLDKFLTGKTDTMPAKGLNKKYLSVGVDQGRSVGEAVNLSSTTVEAPAKTKHQLGTGDDNA